MQLTPAQTPRQPVGRGQQGKNFSVWKQTGKALRALLASTPGHEPMMDNRNPHLLISPVAVHNCVCSFGQNTQIAQQRPLIDVVTVQLHPLVVAQLAAP